MIKERARPMWTKEEDDLLRELYLNNDSSKLKGKFNRTYAAIQHRIQTLHLKHSKEYLDELAGENIDLSKMTDLSRPETLC